MSQNKRTIKTESTTEHPNVAVIAKLENKNAQLQREIQSDGEAYEKLMSLCDQASENSNVSHAAYKRLKTRRDDLWAVKHSKEGSFSYNAKMIVELKIEMEADLTLKKAGYKWTAELDHPMKRLKRV